MSVTLAIAAGRSSNVPAMKLVGAVGVAGLARAVHNEERADAGVARIAASFG